MALTDKILRYLDPGQASSSALADALEAPESSILRALAFLLREESIETSTIKNGTITVYRLTTTYRLDHC
jgi:predicted ArsR family transcriptional regulator